MWVQKCLGTMVTGVSWLIKLTLRPTVLVPESSSQTAVLAFWHGKQFVPSLFFPDTLRPVTAMVSASKDGQIMSTFLHWLGFNTIRGSSNRKAVSALVMLLKVLRSGQSVAVTPDGPRGPIYCAKPGVGFLATKTGRPIVPFGSAISRKWVIKSWDRYEIPKPFARCVFVVGEPVWLPKDITPEGATQLINNAIFEADLKALRVLHGITCPERDDQCQNDKKNSSNESS